MHANNREEIKEVLAGDIAACVGLKECTTGETLCDPDAPIILERMVFPDPVIHVAVEPKTKADQEKMGIALNRAWRLKIRRSACVPMRSRADHHLRYGRAAPRDHCRSHEARIQR